MSIFLLGCFISLFYQFLRKVGKISNYDWIFVLFFSLLAIALSILKINFMHPLQ